MGSGYFHLETRARMFSTISSGSDENIDGGSRTVFFFLVGSTLPEIMIGRSCSIEAVEREYDKKKNYRVNKHV